MEQLNISLDEKHAWALAQFLKRVGFSDIRNCAKSDDEAYLIQTSFSEIREALNDIGINPR